MDLSSAFFSRANAVASPSPMAVIVSSLSMGWPVRGSTPELGTSTPFSTCSSVSWSAVSGARLEANPPNVTRPIKSSGRASTNLANVFFTTSRRVGSRSASACVRMRSASRGVRSMISMEPETSTAIAMAMASTLRRPCESDSRGRAAATTSAAAPSRKMNGARFAARARQPAVFAGRRGTAEKRMPLRRPRRSIRAAQHPPCRQRQRQEQQKAIWPSK